MVRRNLAFALGAAMAASMLCLPPLSAQSAPHKHALLIAIEKYNHGRSYFNGRQSDPVDLHTVPDVDALKAVLQTKFQFKPEDIEILDKPEETTHAGIVKAFQKLIDETTPGDIVYFHYSGHGSRAPEHGPESTWNEVDGWNEAIVPSDYKIEDKDHDLNFLIDDDIGALIDKLLAKKPTIFMMTFDCCHSGSITRDAALPTRDFEYPYPDPHPGWLKKGIGRGSDISEIKQFFDKKDDRLIVLSAAQSNEAAHETRDGKESMGLFTYALVRALQGSTKKTTYKDLLAQINHIMIEKNDGAVQNPQMEGQVNNIVMTGTALPPQPVIAVEQKDGGFELEAGTLQQMSVGSKFALYPTNTTVFSEENKIADAEVIETRLITSDLDVSTKGSTVDLNKLKLAKAKETFHACDNDRLHVLLDAGLSKDVSADIKEQLKDDKSIVVKDASDVGNKRYPWDIKLKSANGKTDVLEMETPDGRSMGSIKSFAEAGQPIANHRVAQTVATQSAAGPNAKTRSSGGQPPGGTESREPRGTMLAVTQSGDDASSTPADVDSDANSLLAKLKSAQVCRFLSQLDKPPDDNSMAVQIRLVPVEVAFIGKPLKDGRQKVKYVKDKTVPPDDTKKLALAENDYYMIEVKNTGPVEAYISIVDLLPDGEVQPLFPPSMLDKLNENRIPPDGEWNRLKEPYLFKVTAPFGSEKIKLIALSTPTNLAPLFNAGASRDLLKKDANPVCKMLYSVTGTTRSEQAGVPPDIAWSTDVYELQTHPSATK